MKLESSFSVRAPIDEVWTALLDVGRVVPCLPGAQLLERGDGDVYEVQIDLELASRLVSYRGRVAVVEHDRDGRRATLSVSAAETDGEGRAQAQLVLSVVGHGEVTEGRLASDVSLSGQATVAVERGAVAEAAERLIDGFARNLAVVLGGGLASVNGADPESSMAPAPAPAGEIPAGGRPLLTGAAADAARSGSGETAGEERPRPAEDPLAEAPPAAAGGFGLRRPAGAARQDGPAVERLRSPLAAMLIALLMVGALLRGRRHRARVHAQAGGENPPASGSAG